MPNIISGEELPDGAARPILASFPFRHCASWCIGFATDSFRQALEILLSSDCALDYGPIEFAIEEVYR